MDKRFPIGFWNHLDIDCPYHDDPERVVADWADAGMTLTQSPRFDSSDPAQVQRLVALLDAARKRDVRVMLRDDRTHWRRLTQHGEASYRAALTRLGAQLAPHPAVWGVMIGDEPGVDEFDDACRACRIAREQVPGCMPFLNLLPWFVGVESRVGFKHWGHYLDTYIEKAQAEMLCYDCYVQMNPDPENSLAGYEVYFANLREYQAAAQRHGIPWWTTLLSVAHFMYRPPKEDHFRWQMNTALAHGAQGILWYFFYMVHGHPHVNYRVAPIDEHWERSETYEWLSRICRTALNWHLSLLQELTLQRVYHAGRAWGGVPLLPEQGAGVIAGAVSRHGLPLIVSEFAASSGQKYVMLVNNSQEENTLAELRVRGKHPRLYQMQWEGDETAISEMVDEAGAKLAVTEAWLAPGQAELYRVEESARKS